MHAIAAALLLAATLAVPVAATAQAIPEPKIPPGYQPEIGKDEQGLWGEMQEIEAQLRRSPLVMREGELVTFVEQLACQIAADYCQDMRVYIVRNPGFNASMAPNGMMIVWTGTLVRVRNRSELGTIIGHEIAHYVRTHSIDQWRSARRGLAVGSAFSAGLGAFTGVVLPVGEGVALAAAMSYSREHEREADLLGARLLADAGFEAHATYRVWEMLIDEERRSGEPANRSSGMLRSHPESEQRAASLRAWVAGHFGEEEDAAPDPEYVALLERHYELLMGDLVATNRFGRTEALLERHLQIGVNPALVAYFRAENYRQRGDEGDEDLAYDHYLAAAAGPYPVAAAHRNLGYGYVRKREMTKAREHFRKYLDAAPAADDRAMIDFYLEEDDL